MVKIERAEIISKLEIATGYFILELGASQIAEVAVPGQFVNLKVCENSVEPLLRKPLGIHDVSNNSISLLFKVVGKGTEKLSQIKIGETLSVLGPLGNGFNLDLIVDSGKAKVIIVAGGHGMAPLFFLSKKLLEKNIEIDVFMGVKTEEQLIRLNDIRNFGAHVHIATEDGSCGVPCYITELVEKYLKNHINDKERLVIYACGPSPMLSALAEVAKRAEVMAQVSLDTYMACGIGACLGCAVETVNGYKLACKDGPVFFANEIIWGENKC